jgi:hypothetical protein
MAWIGKKRKCKERHGKAWNGKGKKLHWMEMSGMTWNDMEREGKVWHGKA